MIRKIFCLFAFSSVSMLMISHSHAFQMQSILSCTKIADDKERLSCFDQATKRLLDSLVGSGPVPTEKTAPSREEKIDDFGKSQLRSSPVEKVRIEHKKEEEEKNLDRITLTVNRYAYAASKRFVLFMNNGQVWKQSEGGKIHLPKGEFQVTIKKGMLGGFNMIVPTKRTIIKVKRLR